MPALVLLCIGRAAAAASALRRSPGPCLQRKSTLLVEYKQLRKSNAFIDRRFGGEPPRPAAAAAAALPPTGALTVALSYCANCTRTPRSHTANPAQRTTPA